jgi:hypothetical protein
MQIRPATRPDVTRLHDGAAPFSTRAVVVEDGGEIGIGGVYYCRGQVIAFSAGTAGLRKRARVKLARAAQQIIAAVKAPVFALQGEASTAPGLLAASGFLAIGNGVWVRPCR